MASVTAVQVCLLRQSGSKASCSTHRRTLTLSARQHRMKEVVIASAVRTPFGSFGRSLKSMSAPKLGGVAIKDALRRARITGNEVQNVYMGIVLAANCKMGPARQAAVYGGITDFCPATAINKGFSSGIKSLTLACMEIMSNQAEIVVAGGMESMTNAPFYLPRWDATRFGGGQLLDSILEDCLWDVSSNKHVGMSAEHTAKEFGFTREMQDEYALGSYRKTAEASLKNKFRREVVEVELDINGTIKLIDTDEEFMRNRFHDIHTCRSLYAPEGTITAGNASTLNDGAAVCTFMSADRATEVEGLKPLARVLGFADAACHAIDYSLAPSLCIPKVLDSCGLSVSDVDVFEVSEAFAVIPLVTMKKLGLAPEKVNPDGGAISLGNPIGASGTRQVVHLCYALQPGQIGVAVINNAGGGATGIAIQKL